MRTQPEYADNFGVEGTRDATLRGPGVKGALATTEQLLRVVDCILVYRCMY